jgi:hypothetical protein
MFTLTFVFTNTHGSRYSYAWYSAADWQQHVDWMALAGINRFYAVTGQEEIQCVALVTHSFAVVIDAHLDYAIAVAVDTRWNQLLL